MARSALHIGARTDRCGSLTTNPFDGESGTFLVLLNEEEQYSLWPAHIDVPAGRRIVHPADSRRACLDFIDGNWTDMRPKSLRTALQGDEAGTPDRQPDESKLPGEGSSSNPEERAKANSWMVTSEAGRAGRNRRSRRPRGRRRRAAENSSRCSSSS
ncbi:MbtH family protein [Taklimakanibacter deserti]|uniref:MbtH family protein n=1 Tax=Taklimakanibacter deserti TaxID=2267839 RepID=UPI000E651D81